MKKPELKVHVYADGANKETILRRYREGFVRGFTTNPTLMAKAGITHYEAFAQEILGTVKDLPISFEVFSDDFDDMKRQALKIAAWGANVNVKIPIMNTQRKPALGLIRELLDQGVKLNVTAILSDSQINGLREIMRPKDDVIVSIFAGRIADTGIDPVPVMKRAIKLYSDLPLAKVLWASPREVLNIYQANECGCDIITATDDQIAKLAFFEKSLEDYSSRRFKCSTTTPKRLDLSCSFVRGPTVNRYIRAWLEWLLPFVAFLGLSLFVGARLWKNAAPFKNYRTVTSTEHRNGPTDSSSYANIAEYYLGMHPLDPTLSFQISNWSPGVPVIAATVIGLTGPSKYLIKLFVLSSFLFSIVLTLLLRWYPLTRSRWKNWACLAILVVLPNLKTWTLGAGSSMSEPYTLYSVLIAWSLAVFGIEEGKSRYLFASGVFFAIAAYFRSSMEVTFKLTFEVIVALLAIHLVGRMIWGKPIKLRDLFVRRSSGELRSGLIVLLTVFATAWACTVPWKTYNLLDGRSFAMTAESEYEYMIHWFPSSKIGDFIHGGNIACAADPQLCKLVQDYPNIAPYWKPLTFMTLANHPVEWLVEKVTYLNWFWFDTPWTIDGVSVKAWSFRVVEGLMYLVLGFLGFRWLIKDRTTLSALSKKSILWFAVGFSIAHLAIFLIAHFENRYSLYLRAFCVWIFLLSFSRRNKNLASVANPG